LPQSGTPANIKQILQVAQETGGASPAGITGETHATVQHEEGAGNLLAEHPSSYYTGVALLVFLFIVIFAFVTTRNLTTRGPSRAQTLIEQCVASMQHFCRQAIGEGGERFTPLIGTIFAFVLVSNLMGSLPAVFMKTHEGVASFLPAPTANLSMTIAVSLVVFFVVQYVGIKENGIGGYLKHFAGPMPVLAPLIFPIEVIGALVRPVSLSIRLFGNVFGEETVVAVLVALAVSMLPKWLPVPLQFPMLVFGVFGSIVQAGVYVILTCAYIALAIGEHDSHGHHHEVDVFGAEEPGGPHAPYAIGNQTH